MERDKCKLHPNEQIGLICTEAGCNLQELCLYCVPKHSRHAIVSIADYWKGKLQNIDFADFEEEVKGELKDNINQEGHILVTCGQMKKYILDWGRMLESKISRSISSHVKSIIKSISNYEGKMINNIQELHFDMNKIIENGNQK